MKAYPKTIHTISDLMNDLQTKGLTFSDSQAAENFVHKVGYYRLRGYALLYFNKSANRFMPNTDFDTIIQIYNFNTELSSLLFKMSGAIEVALRARFCEALLSMGDPLIYLDSSLFKDKSKTWQNLSALCAEIGRSDEEFIKHNYDNHDGQIPLWAAVEVMSFGNLSKFICNLNPDSHGPFGIIAGYYKYPTQKGAFVSPSMDMFSSWIHAVVILRNMCAHNSRIYSRSINKKPQIIAVDRQAQTPRFHGLYEVLLAMKYLRPSKTEWNDFVQSFNHLLQNYQAVIDNAKMNLPSDWYNHLYIK